jgi:hypothetical protein
MKGIASTLRDLLAHNIVSFTYEKVNGEIRHAVGTRNLTLAEIHTGNIIPTPKGEEQPNSYYDVEKMGWRSYKPENLISIDGVYAREDTDFAKKPTLLNEPPKETKKGELPKREIPISKPTENGSDVFDKILGGLFGGIGFGRDTDFIPTPAPSEKRFNDGKIHTPVTTERGIELPVGGVPVEDFAKMVAHYVVEEIVERLTR